MELHDLSKSCPLATSNLNGAIYREALTICTTIGGSAKTIIMATSHVLLFDSAYVRRAENARLDD